MSSRPATLSADPIAEAAPTFQRDPVRIGGEPQKMNRAQRRAMERQRRRADKFVTPKGERPLAAPREPAERKPRERSVSEVEAPQPLVGEYFAQSEFWGEFNFRDTILDQLDRYWVYLERMKTRDPDAYGFYRQVGAVVAPNALMDCADKIFERDKSGSEFPYGSPELEEYKRELREQCVLPDWFKENRPAFGCLAYGIDKETEERELEESKKDGERGQRGMSLWIPKFMYYTKYGKPPPEVQPMSGGDVYKMTVWWDRPHDPKYKKKHGGPTEFAVFISRDGETINVLKMIDTEFIPLRHKKSGAHQTRGKTFSIPHRAWHIPSEYENWAKQHHLEPELHLTHLFCQGVKFQEWTSYSMVRVAVHKGDMTAVFGVNVNRLSYFFQDRDLEFTERGVRKKVFHIVRAHERHMASGKVVPVKIHFRGEREFDWASYHVKITIPGLDHFLEQEVDVACDDMYWAEKGTKYLTEPEFGEKLVKYMNEGLGGHKR